MFSEEETIIPDNSEPQYEEVVSNGKVKKIKRLLLILGFALAVFGFILAVIIIINRPDNGQPVVVNTENETDNENNNNNLPDTSNNNIDENNNSNFTSLTDLEIEYLSFSDFYKELNDVEVVMNFNNYDLPINIKIDGLNYYDLSRKLNLDPVISDINNVGFAIVENPWQNEVDDFYGVYKKLEEKQIPFFITSDFMIYYYQNMVKQMFKGIEENVFYDNLWAINKELYDIARTRYETRLASIGNINDAILEGQRMEMAFFAVSLELLNPSPDQIATRGAIEDNKKFTEGDAKKFNFTPLPYMKDDILREVRMIKEAKESAKSPTMLYVRDYRDFTVPKEYKIDAKLHNFYLASKWLNSVFPIEYQSETCPDCLLEQEDWRLSMIAASLISSDFSSRESLKGRWAVIYKLMGFFHGLREEIDYIDYRDAIIAEFGEDYNIEEIFGDQNSQAASNLERLKNKLLSYEFSEIRGAINKNDPKNKKLLGFKMLTSPYWPNDYVFNRLTWPVVGKYQGVEANPYNLTSCNIENVIRRCNGISLDIVNLVTPMKDNEVFIDNSNYLNYEREANLLRDQLNRDGVWHTSNYWATISLMKSLIHDGPQIPAFTKSSKWSEKNVNTAMSAWVNFQLPMDEFSITPVFKGQTLGDAFNYDENVYVEPNLALLNELISTSHMIAGMFSALGIDREVNMASQTLQTIDNDLSMLKSIVVKELSGESISEEESEELRDFAKRYKVDNISTNEKILRHANNYNSKPIVQDLRKLKLMVITHKVGNNLVMAVGPIWNYKESR